MDVNERRRVDLGRRKDRKDVKMKWKSEKNNR